MFAMDSKERIKESFKLLRSRGLVHTQRDLAKRLNAGEGTVSKALKGDPASLTPQFLMRLNQAFPGVFTLEWLLNGTGEMLQASEKQTEPEAETGTDNMPDCEMSDGMLELYARMIRGVDDLRVQLKDELSEVKALKSELQQARDDFRDAASRLTQILSSANINTAALMVADEKQNPNK
jgi:transcriptional regulator with XRE-family HTH domain